MYGYLRWDRPRGKKDRLTNTYKCYYCGLCNAMKKNYGLRSLFFLSNDITLILVAISKCTGKCLNIPKCCLREKNSKINDDFASARWQHLAAISIGIAYAKALDDWLDEKTFFSRIKFTMVKILSAKARNKQSGLFNMLEQAMQNIKIAEDNNGGLEEQGDLTATMLIDAIQYEEKIYLDEAHRLYVSSLAKWLCLMDAIDDFDKDKKENKYNPLHKSEYRIEEYQNKKVTLKEVFIATYYSEIAKIYYNITSDMIQALNDMQTSDNEREILITMTYKKMPKIFYKILQRRGQNE